MTRRHLVWATGRYETRPATIERDLRWFRREVSYPERNNYTDAYEPVFYADVSKFAGHLKYRRGNQPVRPYYWRFAGRRGDIEWTVGETSVFLTMAAPGRLLVQARSQMPNTTAIRIARGAEPSVDRDGDVHEWEPDGGEPLHVAAVNAFGRVGPETVCRLIREEHA